MSGELIDVARKNLQLPQKVLFKGRAKLEKEWNNYHPKGIALPTLWTGMTCAGTKTCPPGWTLTGLYTTKTAEEGDHVFEFKAYLMTDDRLMNRKSKIISWGVGTNDGKGTERFLCESTSLQNIGEGFSSNSTTLPVRML